MDQKKVPKIITRADLTAFCDEIRKQYEAHTEDMDPLVRSLRRRGFENGCFAMLDALREAGALVVEGE